MVSAATEVVHEVMGTVKDDLQASEHGKYCQFSSEEVAASKPGLEHRGVKPSLAENSLGGSALY